MSSQRQRLELTWIGKENRPKLEPRILLEDTEKSYHARHRVTDHDLFDNRLIFGDNLLALKALEQEFSGRIKCIYIDPPYNTRSAFEHYDDSVEHSLWLSLMRDRLELLRRLLRDDGSIWVSIDDNECHYLKVMMDEFVYAPSDTVYWEHGHSTERDFIYVITQNMNHAQLQQLSDEVGPNRTLLVMCTAFKAKPDAYQNVTTKKIPKSVLARCEWDQDDYSLQVDNLPKAPPKRGQQELFLEAEGDGH
jgi:DNA methylase